MMKQETKFGNLGKRIRRYQNYVELASQASNPKTRLFYLDQAERLAETEIPEMTRAASLQRQLEALGEPLVERPSYDCPACAEPLGLTVQSCGRCGAPAPPWTVRHLIYVYRTLSDH